MGRKRSGETSPGAGSDLSWSDPAPVEQVEEAAKKNGNGATLGFECQPFLASDKLVAVTQTGKSSDSGMPQQ